MMWDSIKSSLIKYASPFALCVFTGPFNTASILLQVTAKPLGESFDKKVEMAGNKAKLVKTGIYGDNRIFRAQRIKGYNDCLSSMGKEGIRGIYKGNFIGALLSMSNAKLRTESYNFVISKLDVGIDWKINLLSTFLGYSAILTCTLADLLTMPLLLAQNRLVLQNSLPRFRSTNLNLCSLQWVI